jgi:hypothetical protein
MRTFEHELGFENSNCCRLYFNIELLIARRVEL